VNRLRFRNRERQLQNSIWNGTLHHCWWAESMSFIPMEATNQLSYAVAKKLETYYWGMGLNIRSSGETI
jgi:hypothetical protein